MADNTTPALPTDEATETRLRTHRTRTALAAAPRIVEHIRSMITPGLVNASDGMPRATSPDPSTPLRMDAADDSDALYAQLINWVHYWAEVLPTAPPAPNVVAWSNDREPQGFRAGTTPAGAKALVEVHTMWLMLRAQLIATHPQQEAYQNDIIAIVGTLRSRYPTAPGSERLVSSRACPVCGEAEVAGTWLSEDHYDVRVECGHCGWFVPPKYYREALRWMDTSTTWAARFEPAK
ncbi:hypothetical protein [Marisediminicola senii]|uniref:hypothetical protein n=1 Tax=Marisediminicola senii TaxID=2711233 RepID=UPI0013E9F4C8|nr:hypothetical protein [Marisediminicola senii]